MESLWTELLVAVITALISVVITWTKKEQIDIAVEDKYAKYALVFQVSGELIRALDEKLYVEMDEALKKMRLAYQSPEFTTKMFQEIVKESKDVFDRANELIKNRS